MEAGETDLHTLLGNYSGKPISLNFIRYIWEQASLRPSGTQPAGPVY